jgi:thymidylate kinase
MSHLVFSFDGAHGTGKDTLIAQVKEWLESDSHEVLYFSERWAAEQFYIPPLETLDRENVFEWELWWLIGLKKREEYVAKKLERAYPGTIVLENRDFRSSLAYTEATVGRDYFYSFLQEEIETILNTIKLRRVPITLTCSVETAMQRIQERDRAESKQWHEDSLDFWIKVDKNFKAFKDPLIWTDQENALEIAKVIINNRLLNDLRPM